MKKEIEGKFLWSQVYPTDSDKQTVDVGVSVSITSPPDEVVQRAVDGAAVDFDRTLLKNIGEEVFQCDSKA